MAFPLALGVGLGAKFLGGLFGKKSAKKKEEAQRKATIGGAELKQGMGEDTRQARVAAAQSLLGQAGSDFALDPALAAQLAQRRSYDFSRAVPEAGAGGGSGFLSGLLGDVSDYAFQYGANQQDQAPMSVGQPVTQAVPPSAARLGLDYEQDYPD